MATLSPICLAVATDSTGAVMPNAHLYFYATGGLVEATVYTTSALSVAHTQPVEADAGGRFPAIYYDDAVLYRAVLKNEAEDETVFDVDPVNPVSDSNEALASALSSATTSAQSANDAADSAQSALEQVLETSAELYVDLTGDTMTGPLLVQVAGGGTSSVSVYGEGGVNVSGYRYSADGNAANFALAKARGTISAPASVITGDDLFTTVAQGYSSSAFRTGANMKFTCIAVTPSSTDMHTRWTMSLCPIGSVTNTEILRADHSSGLSMFGTNPVIDQNRNHRLRSYTVATLPAATTAGLTIYVSDEAGGAVVAFSDGADWRRVTDRAVVS